MTTSSPGTSGSRSARLCSAFLPLETPFSNPSEALNPNAQTGSGNGGRIKYGRTAPQVGLQQERKLGVNPYKFGMVGSTDAHTSLATTREENNWSKTPTMEPSADRWEHVVIASVAGDERLTTYSYDTLFSGLAGVWARENTREALFDAMQKKETYATTGALLRRLGVRRGRGLSARRGRDRLPQGCPHGR